MSNFQSYLILNKTDPRPKTLEILNQKGLKKITVSPDIFFISPQKTSIGIDEVRSLKHHIFQKPVSLPYKFIIFEQAHKLTPVAQNALLKILEEPPASAIIILEAESKHAFLPTILSRVVVFKSTDNIQVKLKDKPLTDFDSLSELLSEIPQISDPKSWLDNQTRLLGEKLKESINKSDSDRIKKITKVIRLITQTKKMLTANVNPRHALANLMLNLTS